MKEATLKPARRQAVMFRGCRSTLHHVRSENAIQAVLKSPMGGAPTGYKGADRDREHIAKEEATCKTQASRPEADLR